MRSSTKKKAKYYVFPAVIQASSSLSLSRSLVSLSLSLSSPKEKRQRTERILFIGAFFIITPTVFI